MSLRRPRLEPLERRTLLSTLNLTGSGATVVNGNGGGGTPAPTFPLGEFVSANGALLFMNDDGVHGAELWRSDGTAKGTMLVKDIRPGPLGSSPSFIRGSQGITYFTADDGDSGRELWETDGTTRGTVMLDVGYPGGSYPGALGVDGRNLLFSTINGQGDWYTDGLRRHTFRIDSGGTSAEILVGDALYFLKQEPGQDGELWQVRGQFWSDFVASGPAFNNAELLAVDGHLFVLTGGDGNGGALWQFDPATKGLTRLAVTTPQFPASIVARVANKTYFAFESYESFYPTTTGPRTLDLYVTDGTAAGTRSVWRQTFTAKFGSSTASFNFTPVGNRLYFTPPAANPAELWTTDGTVAGTKLVRRGVDATPMTHLVDAAGTLYFTHAAQLWRSDGKAAGTTPVLTLPSPSTAPGDAPSLTAIGSRLFFVGDDVYHKGNLRTFDTAAAAAPGAPAAAAIRTIDVGLPPITISKRRMTVNGSADRDSLSVYVNVRRGTLNVVWNGVRSSFAVTDVRSVTVNGGDGDDSIILDGPVPWAVVYGGDGHDYLAGGSGNDTLNGGPGLDTLAGGMGPDVFSGGADNDEVDYGDRTDDLTISHDDLANDGAPGERDNVQTDVEMIFAGAGDDHLIGGRDQDRMWGRAGNDTLEGGGGPDSLGGEEGDDLLLGGAGDDSLYGDRDDYGRPDNGSDTLDGGNGDDYLDGGTGADHLIGGRGYDFLNANDGGRDFLDGGADDDAARLDRRDARTGIEQLLS